MNRFNPVLPSLEPSLPIVQPTLHPPVKEILGMDLDGSKDKRVYVPSHLPPFPAKYAYMKTPVYPPRPTSPRHIRELAAEETRQAETALRRMIDAYGGDPGLDEDADWTACWQALGFDGEIDRAVNADRIYFRKVKTAPGIFT